MIFTARRAERGIRMIKNASLNNGYFVRKKAKSRKETARHICFKAKE